MNLLPIGHCHQSVAGLCQAPVTKKNMLCRRWDALPTYHQANKFSGGNPERSELWFGIRVIEVGILGFSSEFLKKGPSFRI